MFLGKLPRPCAGLSLPEVQLKGVLRGYRKNHVLGTIRMPYPVEGVPEVVELESFPIKDPRRICRWAESFPFKLSEGLNAEGDVRSGIAGVERFYRCVKRTKEEFGFEIILDSRVTTKAELLLVLEECRKRGIELTSIAPGIGFVEGKDYRGDLSALETIIKSLCDGRVLFSIENGGGTSPYSRKGAGVYRTVAKATDGRVKYCASAPYRDLVFWVLCYSEEGRGIFHRAFERTLPGKRHVDHRDPAFRKLSHLALEDKDTKDEIKAFYRDCEGFKNCLDRENERFTSGLIRALSLQENVKFLACDGRKRGGLFSY